MNTPKRFTANIFLNSAYMYVFSILKVMYIPVDPIGETNKILSFVLINLSPEAISARVKIRFPMLFVSLFSKQMPSLFTSEREYCLISGKFIVEKYSLSGISPKSTVTTPVLFLPEVKTDVAVIIGTPVTSSL